VPLWEGSVRDELAGRYDPETEELRSPDAESEGAR
jgi:hypothetical protein